VVDDQSGNNADLSADTSTDEDNQPTIYTGGAGVLRGTNSILCPNFDGLNGFGDSGGDNLKRSDSLGLSGNPGVIIWALYEHDNSTEDKGVFSVGQGPNGSTPRGVNLMTSNGRMDVSAQVGTSQRYLDPNRTDLGYYQLVTIPSGDLSDSFIIRNGGADTDFDQDQAGSSDAFAITSFQTAMGSMLFANESFSADGWICSVIVLSGAEEAGDKTAIEAFWDPMID
jgi:hypothetical protein